MSIDELIAQLESAAELATDGEWHAHLSFLDVWDEHGIVASTPAQAVTDEEAQAIAIRHNTSGDVLRELQSFVRTSAATIESNAEAVRRLVESDEIRDVQHGEVMAAVAKLKADHASELKTQRARADLAEARANELYGCLREAEDIGVEDSMFDEDERRTGPSGWDVDNERRWIESTKDPTP